MHALRSIVTLLLLSFTAGILQAETPDPTAPQPFNYVIGTQAIGGRYHFTQDAPLLESAKLIAELGSA
jgi:hypothetical protein